MTAIKLDDRSILAFDGTIIERFYGATSYRAHVGALHDIQVETDRKGKHWLVMDKELSGGQLFQVEEQVYGQVNMMVAEIQKAMSTFRADNK